MRQSMNSTPIMMQLHPNSLVAEAYRALRFNIEFSVSDREVKTIAITSVSRGEGKTTTALNLATAYAQAGKKVILIDADLRNPSAHLAFSDDNRKGLTNILAGQNGTSEVIIETNVQNLSFLAAGPLLLNPSELLASKQMNELLKELKQSYDIIVVDTSPVLPIMDGKIIAAKCDGILLVVEFGKLKRKVAKKVKEDLILAKADLIGVVVTKIKNKDARVFYFQ